MNNQYNEYVKAYNELAEKLEKLGANDEIFEELGSLCQMALNINIDMVCN